MGDPTLKEVHDLVKATADAVAELAERIPKAAPVPDLLDASWAGTPEQEAEKRKLRQLLQNPDAKAEHKAAARERLHRFGHKLE